MALLGAAMVAMVLALALPHKENGTRMSLRPGTYGQLHTDTRGHVSIIY